MILRKVPFQNQKNSYFYNQFYSNPYPQKLNITNDVFENYFKKLKKIKNIGELDLNYPKRINSINDIDSELSILDNEKILNQNNTGSAKLFPIKKDQSSLKWKTFSNIPTQKKMSDIIFKSDDKNSSIENYNSPIIRQYNIQIPRSYKKEFNNKKNNTYTPSDSTYEINDSELITPSFNKETYDDYYYIDNNQIIYNIHNPNQRNNFYEYNSCLNNNQKRVYYTDKRQYNNNKIYQNDNQTIYTFKVFDSLQKPMNLNNKVDIIKKIEKIQSVWRRYWIRKILYIRLMLFYKGKALIEHLMNFYLKYISKILKNLIYKCSFKPKKQTPYRFLTDKMDVINSFKKFNLDIKQKNFFNYLEISQCTSLTFERIYNNLNGESKIEIDKKEKKFEELYNNLLKQYEYLKNENEKLKIKFIEMENNYNLFDKNINDKNISNQAFYLKESKIHKFSFDKINNEDNENGDEILKEGETINLMEKEINDREKFTPKKNKEKKINNQNKDDEEDEEKIERKILNKEYEENLYEKNENSNKKINEIDNSNYLSDQLPIIEEEKEEIILCYENVNNIFISGNKLTNDLIMNNINSISNLEINDKKIENKFTNLKEIKNNQIELIINKNENNIKNIQLLKKKTLLKKNKKDNIEINYVIHNEIFSIEGSEKKEKGIQTKSIQMNIQNNNFSIFSIKINEKKKKFKKKNIKSKYSIGNLNFEIIQSKGNFIHNKQPIKLNITKEIENSFLSKEESKENSTDISKCNNKEFQFFDKNESNERITKDKSIELINKIDTKQDNSYFQLDETVPQLPLQDYNNFGFNQNNESEVSNTKKFNDIIHNKNELINNIEIKNNNNVIFNQSFELISEKNNLINNEKDMSENTNVFSKNNENENKLTDNIFIHNFKKSEEKRINKIKKKLMNNFLYINFLKVLKTIIYKNLIPKILLFIRIKKMKKIIKNNLNKKKKIYLNKLNKIYIIMKIKDDLIKEINNNEKKNIEKKIENITTFNIIPENNIIKINDENKIKNEEQKEDKEEKVKKKKKNKKIKKLDEEKEKSIEENEENKIDNIEENNEKNNKEKIEENKEENNNNIKKKKKKKNKNEKTIENENKNTEQEKEIFIEKKVEIKEEKKIKTNKIIENLKEENKKEIKNKKKNRNEKKPKEKEDNKTKTEKEINGNNENKLEMKKENQNEEENNQKIKKKIKKENKKEEDQKEIIDDNNIEKIKEIEKEKGKGNEINNEEINEKNKIENKKTYKQETPIIENNNKRNTIDYI